MAVCPGNGEDCVAAHAHLLVSTLFVLNCEWTAHLLVPGSDSTQPVYCKFTKSTMKREILMTIISVMLVLADWLKRTRMYMRAEQLKDKSRNTI